LRFMDFPGLWQHTTVPVSELTLDSFDHGFGFDGSSIRGWQAINESDMLLVPVPETARLDPFMQHTTLHIICDVRDPITKREYSRDPRSKTEHSGQMFVVVAIDLSLRNPLELEDGGVELDGAIQIRNRQADCVHTVH